MNRSIWPFARGAIGRRSSASPGGVLAYRAPGGPISRVTVTRSATAQARRPGAPSWGPVGDSAIRKLRRNLVPFLFLLFVVAYLDRVNVGFAASTMNDSIGLTAAQYGFGAGIFFVGYFFFEVPSNLLLKRYGARLIIGRIMLTWGLVSMATAFVVGPTSFYAVRILLGIAEAGFFPGVMLMMTLFFPQRDRGRAMALFYLAVPIAGVLGAPLSKALMNVEGILGLEGWQFMFLVEGLPAIALAFVVWSWLPNRPHEAKFLTQEERDWLQTTLDREQSEKAAAGGTLATGSFGQALRSARLWVLALVFFGFCMGFYGIALWMPQIIDAFPGITSFEAGLLGAIPFAVGALAMFFTARHSDRTGERAWHTAGPALIAVAAFALLSVVSGPVLQLIVICVAAGGAMAMLPMFWTLPTSFLGSAAAAGGIAAVNSIGNLGGFAGPYAVGFVKDEVGTISAGLLFVAAVLAVAALLILLVVRPPRVDPGGA